MKRLFYLVVIIALPLIVYFEYDHYVRHYPPSNAEYEINDSIDADFYDQELVLRYYKTAAETGTYARHVWKEHKIDVKSASPIGVKSKEMVKTYQQYLATTRYLEAKLLRSAKLKSQGLTNWEIREIFTQNLNPEELSLDKIDLSSPIDPDLEIIQFGDRGETVSRIQQFLRQKGYNLFADGIYNERTQAAVTDFQEKHKLEPTGNIGFYTLEKLME